MTSENAINNTYQIAEEFKNKIKFYKGKRKRHFTRYNQPGKVRSFSEAQIFVYRLKKLDSSFKNLTICGN